MAAWTTRDLPNLDGKLIVVTGANSGIGLEAARGFAGAGAHVVLACRSASKGAEAIENIRRDHAAASLEVMALDLGSLASVRAFAAALVAKHPRIDVLCNNAGLMAPPRGLTADGFELQIGTNHLGPFALTGLVLEALIATPGSRIVTVSSLYHRMGAMRFDDLQSEQRYSSFGAYAQSKLANLLFAFELDRKLRARGVEVRSVACHPGYANTNLQHQTASSNQSAVGAVIARLGNGTFAQSAASGARPTLYAATVDDVQGGDFIGSGFLELWGSPRKVGSSRRSRDEVAAARLWEISETLTGVRYP